MFGDIKKLMKRIHAKLDDAPVKLNIPTDSGQSYTYMLHRRDLQEFASSSISDPGGAKRLLQLYLAIDNNMWEPIIAVIKRYNKPNQPISFKPMPVAMDLASGMSTEKRLKVKEQAKSALLKDYLNFSYHLTDILPDIDLGDDFRKKPKSSVPTLLLSGTLDGRTYIQSQQESVSGLSSLTTVTINNAGHNLFMFSATVISPEVEQVMKAFMRGEIIENTDITIPLPNFAQF